MPSTITVGVTEARDRLSELVNQAMSGVDIVITRRSVPVAKLTAIEAPPEKGNGAHLARLSKQLMKQHSSRMTSAEIDDGIQHLPV
jgi:prevent-host-death family protein